ncbi:MAG: hypothetical protein WCG80_10475 [Spirochaetales bacterium]
MDHRVFQRPLRILIGATFVAIFAASCSLFGGGTVNLKVSVTPPTASRALMARSAEGARALTVPPASQTLATFTPDSLKVRLVAVTIAKQMTFDTSAGGLVAGDAPQALLFNKPDWITLTPAATTTDAFDVSPSLPLGSPTQFGGVLICYGDGATPNDPPPYSSHVKVTGTYSVAGETHTVTDLLLSWGTTGIGLNMPSLIDTSTGDVPVVRLVFDLDDSVLVKKDSVGGGDWVEDPNNPGFFLSLNSLLFVPYVGSKVPTVEKFAVDLDPTLTSYDPDQWFLRVVLFFDGTNLAGGGFRTAARLGNTLTSITFSPGTLYFPKLTGNTDGTWKIDSEDYGRGPSSNVVFPAFGTGTTGSGTLQYSPFGAATPQTLAYTATKLN